MTQFRYFLNPGFSNYREVELIESAKIVVRTCLGVEPGESVAIITDTMQSWRLAKILATAVDEAGAESVLSLIKPRQSMYGPSKVTDPPRPLFELLARADAALLIGTTGLIWSEAAQNALRGGTRILSSPGISEDNFSRCVMIDYDEVWQITKKIQDIFAKGTTLRVTSPQGTDLSAELAYSPKWECDGRLEGKSDFDFLPTGFAQYGIREKSAHGRLVIDGSFSRIGILREPIVAYIEEGKTIGSEGGFEKREFTELLKYFDDPGVQSISAFTTGTNPEAKFTGQPNEDERVPGMMSIFWGDNSRIFGGKLKACMYLLGTLTMPKIEVDNVIIVEKGRITI